MGRLTAKTAADQEMHKHLGAAVSSVRKALSVAASQSKSSDPVVLRRVRGVISRLKGALSILEGTGTMQPGWDLTDPDLMPEDQKKVRERSRTPPPQSSPAPVGGDS